MNYIHPLNRLLSAIRTEAHLHVASLEIAGVIHILEKRLVPISKLIRANHSLMLRLAEEKESTLSGKATRMPRIFFNTNIRY